MEYDRLFIEDLAESLGAPPPTPGAASAPEDVVATTQAVGEEGDQPGDGDVTTLAVGEEGDQPDDDTHDLDDFADRLADRIGDRFDTRVDAADARLDDVGARVHAFTDHFTVRPTWGTADAVGGATSTGHQGIAPGELHPGDDAIDDGSTGVGDTGGDTDTDVKGDGDGFDPGYDKPFDETYEASYDPGYDDGLDADPVETAI